MPSLPQNRVPRSESWPHRADHWGAGRWRALILLAAAVFAAPAWGLERDGARLLRCGEPVRLLGYGEPSALTESQFNLTATLDTLAQRRLNLMRVALIAPETRDLSPWAGGPGAFDLSTHSPELWERLGMLVEAAEARGITVLVELFEADPERWASSPLNAANNVQGRNGSLAEAFATSGPSWDEVTLPYVQKALATVAGYDNVVFLPFSAEPPEGQERWGTVPARAFVDAVMDVIREAGGPLVATAGPHPEADLVVARLTSVAEAGGYETLKRPVLLSNAGDPASRSTQEGASPVERRAAVAALLARAFRHAAPGRIHVDILDYDVHCESWGTDDHSPRASCLRPDVLDVLRDYSLGNACAPAPPTPPAVCPVGRVVVVDDGDPGYSEPNGAWRSGTVGSVQGDYRAVDGVGAARWQPALPVKGTYRVSAAYRPGALRGVATYRVGTVSTSVEQAGNSDPGPAWADLGLRVLAPGDDVSVEGSEIAADAMVFRLTSCDSCVAACAGKAPGASDGCGGTCAEECPRARPGSTTRFAPARVVLDARDAGLAADPPDGRFALPSLEGLRATAFSACDPPGEERVDSVRVEVRADRGSLQLGDQSVSVDAELPEWVGLELPAGATWDTVRALEVSFVPAPGARVDSFRALVSVTGCTPEATRTCQDGDAYWVDTCGQPGALAEICDDLDPCTSDSCADGACVHTPLTAPGCGACTPKAQKLCVGTTILWLNSCGVATEQVAACDDGDPCTVDGCASLVCTHDPAPLPECGNCTPFAALGCVADTNVWLDSCGNVGALAGSCDDGNPCTIDGCDALGVECVHTATAEGPCAACPPEQGRVCSAGAVHWADGCGVVGALIEACDDGDPCTTDACDPLGAVCTHAAASGAGCPECGGPAGLACVGGSLAEKDECGHAIRVLTNCRDGLPCTVDDCNAAIGACESQPALTPECATCPPKQSETCSGGHVLSVDGCGVVAGLQEFCDDGDPCTVAACNPTVSKCFYFASSAPYCQECTPSSDTACSGGAVVRLDTCGKPIGLLATCVDDDDCTLDGCDPATVSCTHEPDPECTPCQPDASFECRNGSLSARDSCGNLTGLVDACDDGDPCTEDGCPDGAAACEHLPSCPVCAPKAAEVCLGGDRVWLDGCGAAAGVAESCDDGEPCTEDGCDATTGQCAHAPTGCGCEPSDRVVCLRGALVAVDSCGNAGKVVDSCADGDPCTADGCRDGQCTHEPSGAAECRACAPAAATSCGAGGVVWLDACGGPGAVALPCDDGRDCTVDTCKDVACGHEGLCTEEEPCLTATARVCENGNVVERGPCGEAISLVAGCNDDDPCTLDGCVNGRCVHHPVASADCAGVAAARPCNLSARLECRDQGVHWVNACGEAVGLVEVCQDEDVCTQDGCAEGVCTFEPIEDCAVEPPDAAPDVVAPPDTDRPDTGDAEAPADGGDLVQGFLVPPPSGDSCANRERPPSGAATQVVAGLLFLVALGRRRGRAGDTGRASTRPGGADFR